MQCIFCKNESSNSKSVEHIFPESLGNTEHVLRKGVVCDTCNQYFASKIEKQVLETAYFVNERHIQSIPSKKNRIPMISAFMGGEVFIDKYAGGRSIVINDSKIVNSLKNGIIKSMIVPKIDEPTPDCWYMSRFLGKIGIEILAQRFTDSFIHLNEIVNEVGLDPLRNFVRFGNRGTRWQYSQRRIHPGGAYFSNPSVSKELYQVLHEAQIIQVRNELLVVIGIMGIEYAINLENPNIDSYAEWLSENKGISPLEDGRILIKKGYPDWQAGDPINFVSNI